MENTFTEGEWVIEKDSFNGGYSVEAVQEGWQIGTQYIAQEINQGLDNGLADAKLIAAAPDLLGAAEGGLQMMKQLLEQRKSKGGMIGDVFLETAIESAEKAIEKALN